MLQVNIFSVFSSAHTVYKAQKKTVIAAYTLYNAAAAFRKHVRHKLTAVKPVNAYRGLFTFLFVLAYAFAKRVEIAFDV